MKRGKAGVIKSTGLYSVGMIFLRASSFLLLPFYSKVFTPEEFGNYTLILSFYTILAVIVQAGFQATLTKYYVEAENKNDKKSIFSTIVNTLTLVSITAALILTLFSRQTSLLLIGVKDYNTIVITAAVLLIIETVTFYNLHLLRAKEESKKYVSIVTSSAIVNLFSNYLFIAVFKFGIVGIFFAQIVSSSVSFLMSIESIKDDYSLKIDSRLLKKLFIFSIPLLVAGILSTLVDLADRFIINHYLGAKDVGSYSFAYRIAMVMNIVVISFGSVWNPRSLDDIKQKLISQTMPCVFTKLLFLLSFIFLGVSLLIDDLFTFNISGKVLFGQEYYGGVIIIPFILLSYLFRGVSTFYSVYPLSSGKSYHFLVGDLLGFISNIFLNIVLIPIYGLVGAAIATLVSYLIIAAYSFLISFKVLRIRYEKLKLLSMLMISLIFFATSYKMKNLYLDITLLVSYFLYGFGTLVGRNFMINLFDESK